MSATPLDPEIATGLPKHEFLAGRVALNFCNSLSPTLRVGRRDRIISPVDFLTWAERAGIDIDGAPTPQVLAGLHRLRSALIGIFHALSERRVPGDGDLALLNAEISDAHASERLVVSERLCRRRHRARRDRSVAAPDRARCRRSAHRRPQARQTLPGA